LAVYLQARRIVLNIINYFGVSKGKAYLWGVIKTKNETIMKTMTIDNNTYHDIETFAHVNNLDVADVVKKSFRFFIEEFKLAKPQAKTSQYQLPSHLKKCEEYCLVLRIVRMRD